VTSSAPRASPRTRSTCSALPDAKAWRLEAHVSLRRGTYEPPGLAGWRGRSWGTGLGRAQVALPEPAAEYAVPGVPPLVRGCHVVSAGHAEYALTACTRHPPNPALPGRTVNPRFGDMRQIVRLRSQFVSKPGATSIGRCLKSLDQLFVASGIKKSIPPPLWSLCVGRRRIAALKPLLLVPIERLCFRFVSMDASGLGPSRASR
jgi:hypothetical protein